MMDIEAELERIIAAKTGNKELAIFYEQDPGYWSIMLGNPAGLTFLGEVPSDIEVDAKTLEGAILKLKAAVEEWLTK